MGLYKRQSARARNPLIPAFVHPPTENSHWLGVDLVEFCGGFDYAELENGDLEITIARGSSPVILPSKDRTVEAILKSVLSGQLLAQSIYSQDEAAALSELPSDHLKQRIWVDYLERSHKPWLAHARAMAGASVDPAVTISEGPERLVNRAMPSP